MRNPLHRYLMATRPAFLTLTPVACALGLANVAADGLSISWTTAALTLFGALLMHAAINVLNDYYDARNGTDNANTERLFPYTGGSRFIQNGVLSEEQTRRFGFALLGAGSLIGFVLSAIQGSELLLLGLLGVFIGWAYSAPPFSLNARGLGELCVAIGFGVLMPLGTDWVQRGWFDSDLLLAALPFGLLVTNILYINQFPDCRADREAGKRHWVVRLGPQNAAWLYTTLAGGAVAALLLGTALGVLPGAAVVALAPAALAFPAATALARHATEPHLLEGAIRGSINAALGTGALLSVALAFF